MTTICPTCGTPLEWSAKYRRFLPCHKSAEATVVIRRASKARRELQDYNRRKQREHRKREPSALEREDWLLMIGAELIH